MTKFVTKQYLYAFIIKSLALLALVMLVGNNQSFANIPHPTDRNLIFYVSPTGSDKANGLSPESKDGANGPFASLQHARDVLRRLRHDGVLNRPIEVRIQPGIYQLDETLMMDERDSGTADFPVIYRSITDQPAVLSGGRYLDNCSRIDSDLLSCDVKALHVQRLSMLGLDSRLSMSLPPFELFADGQRRQLARWPNSGYDHAMGYNWKYIAGSTNDARDHFVFSKTTTHHWKSVRGATVHIWPGNDWFDQYVGIESLDTTQGLMRLKEKTSYPIKPGRRFSILNLREELDTPGEWYYDAGAGRILLFVTPSTNNIRPIISYLDNVIDLRNASHIQIEGLTIENSRKTAITITGGNHNLITHCTIRNTGGFGIEVHKGNRHIIQNSDINNTGYGGIVLNGGDRKTLTASNHIAVGNNIHHTGRLVRTGRAALHLEGVGNTGRNNHIHNTPGMAVVMVGNDHLLELNNIHDTCEESSDCGAIYTGRDWTFHGNIIRYNRIHDIYGYGMNNFDATTGRVEYATPHGARGIYLDDAASGFDITGNLFYRIPYIALQIGGGRDNTVANNIFVTKGYAIWMDARSQGFPWEKIMLPRLRSMPYESPVWRKRYPELAEPMANPQWPEGNRIVNNIILGAPGTHDVITPFKYAIPPNDTVINYNIVWNNDDPIKVDYRLLGTMISGVVDWSVWQQSGFDKNSLIADPQLLDTPSGIKLSQTSPARGLGILNIPFGNIDNSDDTHTPVIRFSSPQMKIYRYNVN